MELIELARKLGEALKDSDEYKNYKIAREICKGDEELKGKIDEFKLQKSLFDDENKKEQPDTILLNSLRDRLDVLYKEINENEIMKKFNKAEDDINMLLQAINMTISSYISDEPIEAHTDGCSHGSCSSCSGCGHHD